MKKLLFAILCCVGASVSAFGQSNPPLRLQEIDGSPNVLGVTTIKVTNGTLSCTGKVCTITISGGGGGSPGGSAGQVQWNDTGAFGGTSGLTATATTVTIVNGVTATFSRAGLLYTGTVTTDNASVQTMLLQGDRATPTANDEAYITYRLSNDGGTQTEVARMTWAIPTETAASEDGRIDWSVMTAGALAKEMQLSGADLSPSTSDGLALGTASLQWSDLFLDAGGVVRFGTNGYRYVNNTGPVFDDNNTGFALAFNVQSLTDNRTMTWPDTALTVAGINIANAWADGVKQTFNPDATNAGINVGSVAGDPSSPANGDLWYDSTANELTARINGANVALGSGGGGGITVGTTTVTGGTATRLFYETAGNVVGQISGATSDGTTVTLTSPTVNTGITLNAAPLTMSGNISSAAWTTNGLRIKGVPATLTDTTSSGTVAAAYTNAYGGNTIAASSSTTFTDYYTTFMTQPTAGSNVTFTRRWALGLSGAAQVNQDSLGTTSTDGLVLQNSTAAAAGAQQYSPRLRLTGQGWKTNATAASQTVDWILEARPVQGAANPTVNLAILAQVNGGGYTPAVAPGAILVPGGGSTSQSNPQLAAVDRTTTGIRWGAGSGGNGFGFVQSGTTVAMFDGNSSHLNLLSSFSLTWASSPSNGSGQQIGLIPLSSTVLRLTNAGTGTVNFLIGTSSNSIGTSGVGVLGIANGTAPSSSPADEFQLYSADSAAGDANAFARNEAGEINRLTGLAARNSSSFAKTSDTTLANITGLTRNVEAERTYYFETELSTTSANTGGVKFAISGTATATAIDYEGVLRDGTTISAATRATALDTTVCAVTAVTAATCRIRGVIVVNAAGTLTVQFAQNVSDGSASTVLVNQALSLRPIS